MFGIILSRSQCFTYGQLGVAITSRGGGCRCCCIIQKGIGIDTTGGRQKTEQGDNSNIRHDRIKQARALGCAHVSALLLNVNTLQTIELSIIPILDYRTIVRNTKQKTWASPWSSRSFSQKQKRKFEWIGVILMKVTRR